jgi:hypothetical protein
MAIELDLSRGWRLARDLVAPEAAVAAAEIEKTLGAGGDGHLEIALSHGDGEKDGFRRRAQRQRLEIHGESPRGLLFGVYATLEQLGARWPWPGEGTPRVGGMALEDDSEHAPALPGRCLVLGERALVEAAESWIVWAARNRLNWLFVHVSTRPNPTGAAPEDTWRDRRERALAAARARGIRIEHGGHLLPELLGRSEIDALVRGHRPSGPVRRILDEHVRAHPEADVLHLWGADRPARAGGGGAASEAALRAVNTVAEVVEEVRPDAQVSFLAYHETEEPPYGVRPRPNVCLLFAPRERCYEHALTDRRCRRNARYRDRLLAQVEHFRAAGAAPARVFEYWFDAILFARGVPDLSEMIREDLAFYREAGVNTVQLLMTGHGRSPASHPNPRAFARYAWDPGPTVSARH